MKLKIESIEYIDSEDKYDIEVENVHNFFANGILVHNCRCIATKDGLFSREGKEFVSVPHISEELKYFFLDNPTYVLDGELYNHELKNDFNTIMSLIKQKKPTCDDLQKSKKLVQYHVYDMVDPEQVFSDRSDTVKRVIDRLSSPSIIAVPTYDVSNSDELDTLYAQFLAEGYEGQMVRLNAPYEQKRSKTLLKRKEFLDAEFPLVSLEEGLGNWAGYAKTAKCRLPDGRIFGAGIKGTQEFTKQLLNGVLPQTVTVRYQNMTPDLVPRFPIAVAFYEGKRDL